MTLRTRSLSLVRICLLATAVAAFALVVAFDGRERPAGADPAFGNVRPWPSAGVIIEGHAFSIPVQMTTCADNATPVSGTATSGTGTTLVNTGASWTTNQWAGYDIQLTSGTSSPQWRVVSSNTSNTLTVSEGWGGILDTGTATAGSTTTLVDAGSGWLNNEFAGRTLEMPALGAGQNRTITSNTADTLTVSSAWSTLVAQNAPTGGTASTLTDSGTGWATNAFVDKTVQIVSGPAAGQSRRIVSNTATVLTIDGTWTTSTGGTLTSGSTTTVLNDATKSWTVNAFAGMTLDMLSGAQAGQSRTIASNTATSITLTSALPGAPAFGDQYRVEQAPTAASQYLVREGPAINTVFQIRQSAPPASGTGYELFKSHCRVGGFDITLNYDDAKFDVTSDANFSTGGNTATTFNDTSRAWKINQWAGSRILITGGTGTGQSRYVVSNTATQLVVSPAWTVIPANLSVYQLGGLSSSNFIENTGRTVTCPGGATYGSGTAELHCVSYGAVGTGLPQGPTGTGNLVNLSLIATNRGLSSITLTAQILEVDSTTIPADVLNATRRVIICPDSAPPLSPDGLINSGDLGLTAQAFGHTPTSPPPPNNKYTLQKDPNEDLLINSGDLGVIAAVFAKRCVQP